MGKRVSNVKKIMNLNHTEILHPKATQSIETDQEVFQKFILSGSSFYKVSTRGIFVPFLCHIFVNIKSMPLVGVSFFLLFRTFY